MPALALSVAAALAAAWSPAFAQEARYGEIAERHATPLVESGATPSLIVGILHDGVMEFHSFGTLSEGDLRRPDERTLFEIGSITKVFTATLLAEAQRRGELSIDDPLGKRLPEGIEPPAFEGAQPTLGQLADHTAGFPALPSNFGATSLDDPYANYTEEMAWEYLNGLRLMRAPGERYVYSNFGAGLLGTIVARAAGMSYADLLRERITGPLALSDTVIELSEEQQARFAPPHSPGGAPSTNWHFQALAGAGAIRSTAADMLVFAAAQLNPPEGGLGESIRLTHEMRADPPNDPTFVALGWHIAGDRVTLAHAGGTNGYRTALYVCPPLDAAVIVLANAAEERVPAVAEKILQSIAGLNPPPIDVQRAATLTEEQLQRLTGTYFAAGIGRYVFRIEDGRLLARLAAQQEIEVFPKTETEFFYRALAATLTFEMAGDGRAAAVTLHQGGRDMRFERE